MFCAFVFLQVSDTGQYVCMASNVAGQVNKNFHLSIHGSLFKKLYTFLTILKQILKRYFPSVPPSIDGPAEESVVETISNPVTLSCDASGIPPPNLIWLKNGHPIGRLRSKRSVAATADVFYTTVTSYFS